jgi:hypothetical protein
MITNLINKIQSFAPDISLIEIEITSVSNSINTKKYIYSYNNFNIFTFEIRSYENKPIIDIVLDISKYKYRLYLNTENNIFNIENNRNIQDFLSHAKIVTLDLLNTYKQLSNKIKIIPFENKLNHYFLNCKKTGNYGTITIKNGMYILDYKDTTKYTYSNINDLLKNPLLKQFKYFSFWN